jgi:DHA2 family multidrug resistance protein
VVALAFFVIWEMTDEHPVVNLRLFAFAISATAPFVGAGVCRVLRDQPDPAAMVADAMGYTATWAGLAVAPLGILPVLLSPFVGKYAPKFDMRLLAGLAFLAIGLSCFMRAGFHQSGGLPAHRHGAIVHGGGVALFFMPTLSILLSDLPPSPDRRRLGAGDVPAYLGGSFAASLTTWIWIRRADSTMRISARASPTTSRPPGTRWNPGWGEQSGLCAAGSVW